MGYLKDIETFIYEMAFREDYRKFTKVVTIVGGGSVGNNVASILAQEEWM